MWRPAAVRQRRPLLRSLLRFNKDENGTNRLSGSRLWQMSGVLGISSSFFFEELNTQPGVIVEQLPPSRFMLELVRAVQAIPDERVRQRLLDLACRLQSVLRPRSIATRCFCGRRQIRCCETP
jgi:hypothetical protein